NTASQYTVQLPGRGGYSRFFTGFNFNDVDDMLFGLAPQGFYRRFLCNFLYQGIPFAAVLTLSQPLRILRATVLTEICSFKFCHAANFMKKNETVSRTL